LKKKIEMNGEKKRREKGGQKVKEKEERNSNAKIGENRGEYRGIKKRKFEAETKTMWRWGVQKRKFIKNEEEKAKKKEEKGRLPFFFPPMLGTTVREPRHHKPPPAQLPEPLYSR